MITLEIDENETDIEKLMQGFMPLLGMIAKTGKSVVIFVSEKGITGAMLGVQESGLVPIVRAMAETFTEPLEAALAMKRLGIGRPSTMHTTHSCSHEHKHDQPKDDQWPETITKEL